MSTLQINATVGDKLLANADSYFTNTRATILDEIIANSRRADARVLVFTLHPTLEGLDLTIADDGRGLEMHNAGVLLSFAASQNSAEVERAENAAGVGFFALARHDVDVASNDWRMSIPRDAFIGKTSATVTDGHPRIAGLSITIHAFENGVASAAQKASLQDYADALARDIIAATRYSGLSIVLNGFGAQDGRRDPEDFLAIPVATALNDIRATRHGVTMRVVRCEHSGYREHRPTINFFGKLLPCDDLAKLIPHEVVGYISDTNQTHPSIRTQQLSARIFVDVHDTSALKLRLPDRDAVIASPGLNALKTLAQELYIRILAGEGALLTDRLSAANGIALDSPLRKAADQLGLSAAIPHPSLTIHVPTADRFNGTDSQPAFLTMPNGTVVSAKGTTIDPATLISVFETQYLLSLLPPASGLSFVSSTSIEQALPAGAFSTLVGLRLHIRQNTEQFSFELADPASNSPLDIDPDTVATTLETSNDYTELSGPVADEIKFELVIAAPDGSRASHFITTSCFYWNEHWDPSLLVTREADRNAVVAQMMDGLFSPSDDGDTWDSQESDRKEEFWTLVTNALGVTEDQMIAEIHEAISAIMSNYHDTFWKHRADMAVRIIPSDNPFGFRIEALPQHRNNVAAGACA